MDTMPVFRLSAEQGQALDRATWATYDPEYLVMPFPQFIIKYDESFEGACAAGASLSLLAHTVRQIEDSSIEIIEHMEARVGNLVAQQTATILFDIDEKRAKMTGFGGKKNPSVKRADGTRGESSWFPVETENPRDTARTARLVTGFLLMLNFRECWMAYGVPPTRQQKRAAQRSGHLPEQTIDIRIDAERIQYAIAASSRGHNTHARRAHAVRGHLRQYQTGKISKVRPHTRGGLPTAIPIYDARSIPMGGMA